MKEIKILWLFNDLLDLYGDSGNITILSFYLKRNGIPFEIDTKGLYDEIDFTAYDFVYCGPGKVKNIMKAAEKLSACKDNLKEAVDKGVMMLFTGSSVALLGNKITAADGNSVTGAGLFEYSCTDYDKVMIEDIVTDVKLSDRKIYGFVNRTMKIDGESDEDYRKGYECNKLWATWLLGPLMVKNPDLLAYYYRNLTGEDLDLSDTLEEKAYQHTMAEFN